MQHTHMHPDISVWSTVLHKKSELSINIEKQISHKRCRFLAVLEDLAALDSDSQKAIASNNAVAKEGCFPLYQK